MRSVADSLRRATRDSVMQLAPEERVERALRLGDDDLSAYTESRGITREVALREIALRRRSGRRHSGAVDSLTS